MLSKALLFFFLTFAATNGYTHNFLHPSSAAVIKLDGYDSTIRPPGLINEDDPVDVKVDLYVLNIEDVDIMRQEFTVQMYLRERWTDTRIAFNDGNGDLITNEVQTFWKPDLFFPAEKDGRLHVITKPNTFIKISKNGTALLSSKITVTLACPMCSRSFPFDTQQCTVDIETYGYAKKDVSLTWYGDDPVNSYASDKFEFTGTSVEVAKMSSGEYTRLVAGFQFKRQALPYILRVFLPLALLVFASWTSFWLPVAAVVPRFAVVSITTISTIILVSQEEEYLHLPNITILDLWVSLSGLFVFAAFFEYIFVTYQTYRPVAIDSEAQKPPKAKKVVWLTIPEGAGTVDTISKIVFPVLYLAMHVVIYPIMLSK